MPSSSKTTYETKKNSQTTTTTTTAVHRMNKLFSIHLFACVQMNAPRRNTTNSVRKNTERWRERAREMEEPNGINHSRKHFKWIHNSSSKRKYGLCIQNLWQHHKYADLSPSVSRCVCVCARLLSISLCQHSLHQSMWLCLFCSHCLQSLAAMLFALLMCIQFGLFRCHFR